ncbi:Hypothetical predicted protein [Mytilus galloprovincialis]|uniref:Uncharacterized protein n=2 Tax=Mytilus galloprovincialis TaxID=29158 RepID=A0A8B6HE46_MYTGA|nr:Hypothetical predicted protein [Mytilus galloprovincialis]
MTLNFQQARFRILYDNGAWKVNSIEEMQSSDTDYHFDNNNTIDMDFCANMEIQTKKRKFEMTTENVTSAIMSGRQFVLLPRNSSTYVTTDWKLTGTSLFLPLKGDTFVNLQKYEQITVADGSYFIADDAGNYSRSVTGMGGGR